MDTRMQNPMLQSASHKILPLPPKPALAHPKYQSTLTHDTHWFSIKSTNKTYQLQTIGRGEREEAQLGKPNENCNQKQMLCKFWIPK